MDEFQFNDGSRSLYFKGKARDCVTRSIAIATRKDYKEVYDSLSERAYNLKGHSRVAKLSHKNPSARGGVFREVYEPYLKSLGWEWVPTMFIGQGCKVHLHKDELPSEKLIVRLSRHLTCVINGVIHDTANPQRGSLIVYKNGMPFITKETRCVYGYFVERQSDET